MIGGTRQSVNKLLSQLVDEGLIRIEPDASGDHRPRRAGDAPSRSARLPSAHACRHNDSQRVGYSTLAMSDRTLGGPSKSATSLLSASADKRQANKSEVEMGQQDKPGVWRPLGGEAIRQRAARTTTSRATRSRAATSAARRSVPGATRTSRATVKPSEPRRRMTRQEARQRGRRGPGCSGADAARRCQRRRRRRRGTSTATTRRPGNRGRQRGQTRAMGDDDDDVEGHKHKQLSLRSNQPRDGRSRVHRRAAGTD